LLSLRRPKQGKAVSALPGGQCGLLLPSPFHANASMAALGAMIAEGSFAMGKRFSLTTFWDEIRSYQATHTNVLGSIFALLARQPRKESDAKNPLKVMNAVPWLPEFEEFEKRFDLN